jgi:hypothetical protein
MTNLDPQTTTDFWDAYIAAADAGAPVRSVAGRKGVRSKARTSECGALEATSAVG